MPDRILLSVVSWKTYIRHKTPAGAQGITDRCVSNFHKISSLRKEKEAAPCIYTTLTLLKKGLGVTKKEVLLLECSFLGELGSRVNRELTGRARCAVNKSLLLEVPWLPGVDPAGPVAPGSSLSSTCCPYGRSPINLVDRRLSISLSRLTISFFKDLPVL